MSHRPVLIPLILAAMLIAGSWVGRGVIAQEPSAQPRTASEVALDLAQPEVLEQIRIELWERRRDHAPELQAIPSAGAMTLTPTSRPIYGLIQDFWTGRTKLVPLYYEGKPQVASVVLISLDGQALATGEIYALDTEFHVSSVRSASMAQTMLAMDPSEKLVEIVEHSGPELYRVRDQRAFRLDSVADGGAETSLTALMVGPETPASRAWQHTWELVTLLAVAVLFPWTASPKETVGSKAKAPDHD